MAKSVWTKSSGTLLLLFSLVFLVILKLSECYEYEMVPESKGSNVRLLQGAYYMGHEQEYYSPSASSSSSSGYYSPKNRRHDGGGHHGKKKKKTKKGWTGTDLYTWRRNHRRRKVFGVYGLRASKKQQRSICKGQDKGSLLYFHPSRAFVRYFVC